MENYLFKIMSRDREKRFGSAIEALDAWRKVCRVMGNAPRRAPPSRGRPVVDDYDRERETDVTAVTNDGGMPSPYRRR